MNNRQDSAQIVALQALGWIAGQDELFARFLAQAGTDAATLRARAAEPAVLGAVLDFLLSDEPVLLLFCADAGLPPQAPMQARAGLPGGDLPHWT